MILCDTGVLVAAINKGDIDHAECAALLRSLREAPITTWPCMTEAMYLLESQAGAWTQVVLRDYISRDAIVLLTPSQTEAKRACALMTEYADAPMDFADASLVVAAEVLGINRILTIDNHFYAYRINGKIAFEVIR